MPRATRRPATQTSSTVRKTENDMARQPPGFPEPPEVIRVRTRRVACDGVGGALGHPRVWLEMGDENAVECGYCDRRFVYAGHDEVSEAEVLAPGAYEGAAGH